MSIESYNYLIVEHSHHYCFVTVNREKQLNALNKNVLLELKSFFENTLDLKAKGIILTGCGDKAFIAGADIKELVALSPAEAKEISSLGQSVTIAMESCPIPVIAAVDGFALGGGLEMALGADFIYCTSKSKFGLPEVSLGLIPGFGGTLRLAKAIGQARAKELIYTAKIIDSSLALKYALVLEVFETKDLMIEACKKTIDLFGKNSSFAIKNAKEVINKTVDLVNETGLEIENKSFSNLFGTKDMIEGTSAFIEKRLATFKG